MCWRKLRRKRRHRRFRRGLPARRSTLPGFLVHVLAHVVAGRPVFGGRHGNRVNCHVMVGQIGVQSRQVASKRLSRVRRSGHKSGVDAASARIRTHPDPAQSRILEACLGPVRTGMNPRRRHRHRIESGKGLADSRCLLACRGDSQLPGLRACSGSVPTCRVAHQTRPIWRGRTSLSNPGDNRMRSQFHGSNRMHRTRWTLLLCQPNPGFLRNRGRSRPGFRLRGNNCR